MRISDWSSDVCSSDLGQNEAFDVGAEPHQILDGMAVIDPHHVLFDDRPVVKVLGHVMSRRADEFDSPLLGSPIWRGTYEGQQKRVMDVDQWTADLGSIGRTACEERGGRDV